MNKSAAFFVALAYLVPVAQATQFSPQALHAMQQAGKNLVAQAKILRPYRLASGKCLNAGGVVTIENCNGTPSQNWKFSPGGQFANQGGTCLTLLGALATVAACQGTARFTWIPTQEGALVHSSGKCLTASHDLNRVGGMVMVAPCNGGPAQIWK